MTTRSFTSCIAALTGALCICAAQAPSAFAASGEIRLTDATIELSFPADAGALDRNEVRDWIMTHEMVHLAMPEFGDSHAWLEEGLATYVEPIARVQAGQLAERTIWRDMLRAIVAHGGNVEVAWDVRKTLAIGDKATGTNVLMELYEEMRAAPVLPDLAQLWQRLGVKPSPDSVEFDDEAPLAAIRRAITARPAG